MKNTMNRSIGLIELIFQRKEDSEDFCIIDEFRIDDDCFLIISIKDDSEITKEKFLQLSSNNLKYSKVGEIEVNGKFYAIVKTTSSVDNVEPNLTTLLTERELQIAALVALGWSNKQVARKLCISEWTVGTHLRRIFIKLGVDSRAAMTYRCASLIRQLHQLGRKQH